MSREQLSQDHLCGFSGDNGVGVGTKWRSKRLAVELKASGRVKKKKTRRELDKEESVYTELVAPGSLE